MVTRTDFWFAKPDPAPIVSLYKVIFRIRPCVRTKERILDRSSVELFFANEETKDFVSEAVCPLLEAIMLLDNDAWAMFDPATKARYRDETLAVFRDVQRMINS